MVTDITSFFRDIGPRSKVWSEKELVDRAAYEFAEVCSELKSYTHAHAHTHACIHTFAHTLLSSVYAYISVVHTHAYACS